jgi:hypothetical protein
VATSSTMSYTRRLAPFLVSAALLLLGTGTAEAARTAAPTEANLLTAAEAQGAAGYSGSLTESPGPAMTGILMRQYVGAEDPSDMFSVMVISFTAKPSAKVSKRELEKAKKQAQQARAEAGMECKVVEQAGTKYTIVCWSEDMVSGISGDVSKNVVVTATSMHAAGEDGVTEAMKSQAGNEAKGLRNAQRKRL